MSIRAARILWVGVACLLCLGACSTAPKLNNDTTGSVSSQPPSDGGVTGILSDLWSSKKTASADADTTGSVLTQPAEPGPSGEPVAPLSHPGLVGDDPNDDLQLGKKYFRSNNFGMAEQSFRTAVQKHPNDAEAWVGLAASYDRLHRFDLADRAYAQAIHLIGPTAQILNDQGFSYMLRGDYARAHKTLQLAQAKDPANPYVRANLQLLEESYRNGQSIQ
jgi:tetratricopeptide (TPR) repeat protein